MKRGKLKKWLWNGSMAAALVAAVAVFGIMLQMEKNMLEDYEKGTIYVASKDIPDGQLITGENYQEYLAQLQLDKSCIPPTALIDAGQVNGLVAEADIEAGVLLTEGMFERMNEITGQMEEPVIVGLKAEDLYQVAGGILRAGDRVHIYSVDEENGARLTWRAVFVEQVFDNSGNRISNADRETPVQRINVYMDGADVEAFYSELAAGDLRIVKVCD